jgi:hypothetical protein
VGGIFDARSDEYCKDLHSSIPSATLDIKANGFNKLRMRAVNRAFKNGTSSFPN